MSESACRGCGQRLETRVPGHPRRWCGPHGRCLAARHRPLHGRRIEYVCLFCGGTFVTAKYEGVGALHDRLQCAERWGWRTLAERQAGEPGAA